MIKTATTYPLRDPERYDDEYGEGYDHAAIADEIGPNGVYIADCWIVNRNGEVHPGYSESPVPVLADDLDLEAGFPTVMPERQRGNWGWR